LKSFEVTIEPFRIKLLVHYAPTIDDAIQHHNKNYEPVISPETRYTKALLNIEQTETGPAFCLLLSEESYTDAILVHECLHVIHETADYVGLTLTDSSQEYYAYAIERLFGIIKKKLKIKQK